MHPTTNCPSTDKKFEADTLSSHEASTSSWELWIAAQSSSQIEISTAKLKIRRSPSTLWQKWQKYLHCYCRLDYPSFYADHRLKIDEQMCSCVIPARIGTITFALWVSQLRRMCAKFSHVTSMDNQVWGLVTSPLSYAFLSLCTPGCGLYMKLLASCQHSTIHHLHLKPQPGTIRLALHTCWLKLICQIRNHKFSSISRWLS